MHLFYVPTRSVRNMADPPRNGMNPPNLQPVPPPDINLPDPSMDHIPSVNHPNISPSAAPNIPRQSPPGHVPAIQQIYGPPTTIHPIGPCDDPDRGNVPKFTPTKEADISITNMINSWQPFVVIHSSHAINAMSMHTF